MHTRLVIASVVLLLAAAGLAGAHGWTVEADDQVVGDGTVVVGHVSMLERGYLAVHLVEDGEPGRVVGHRRFPDNGEFGNVEVAIDEEAWPAGDGPVELVAVVHDDDGDRRFDWPDGDAVLRPDDPVADRFRVRRDEGASARLVASRQDSDGNVTLRRADVPATGFVVLYAEADDGRGEVVGLRHLAAGHHENVTVGLAPGYYNEAGSRLYLVAGLHVDDGDGVWEPGDDGAVRVDGSPVTSSFDAATTRESLPTPTPSATPELTPTPTSTAQPTASAGSSPGAEPTATATSSAPPTVTPTPAPVTSPGFGPGAMLASFAVALLALARRR